MADFLHNTEWMLNALLLGDIAPTTGRVLGLISHSCARYPYVCSETTDSIVTANSKDMKIMASFLIMIRNGRDVIFLVSQYLYRMAAQHVPSS